MGELLSVGDEGADAKYEELMSGDGSARAVPLKPGLVATVYMLTDKDEVAQTDLGGGVCVVRLLAAIAFFRRALTIAAVARCMS